MKKIIDGLTTDGKIMYGTAAVLLIAAGLNVLFPGILPAMPAESMPVLAGIFGISFGKSKSENVNSSAAAGYDLQENISQSGSQQGSQQGSQSESFGGSVSSSSQSIYGPQAAQLDNIYAQAQNLYNNYQMPDRQAAGINPFLASGLGNQYGFATGQGQDIYTAQLVSALANMGGYGTAADTANLMASGNVYGTPINRGIDMRTAAQASYNPYLEGQIDAASRDVVRNLGENQLTGNAAIAAGTGNSGSSRRAVMDAIATRGAADRVADIGATMRGNAYNTGLGVAAQQGLANQSATLANNALNAGLMGRGAQLGFDLGQAGQAGLGQAYNTALSNTQQQMDAGNYLRQYQQQLLDTAFQNQMNPYNSLQMYKSFIGDPTVLGSSSSSSLETSSSNSFGNSFGNSFNNSYSYGMGGNTSAGSGTGNASSFNFGPNGGK